MRRRQMPSQHTEAGRSCPGGDRVPKTDRIQLCSLVKTWSFRGVKTDPRRQRTTIAYSISTVDRVVLTGNTRKGMPLSGLYVEVIYLAMVLTIHVVTTPHDHHYRLERIGPCLNSKVSLNPDTAFLGRTAGEGKWPNAAMSPITHHWSKPFWDQAPQKWPTN